MPGRRDGDPGPVYEGAAKPAFGDGLVQDEDLSHLEDHPSDRIVVSYTFEMVRGPQPAAMLKVAYLGSGEECHYLPPVVVLGLTTYCKKYNDQFPDPPGYASQLQWFDSRRPRITQEDVDGIEQKDATMDMAALVTRHYLVVELKRHDGSASAMRLPPDISFRMFADLGEVVANLPRHPGSPIH